MYSKYLTLMMHEMLRKEGSAPLCEALSSVSAADGEVDEMKGACLRYGIAIVVVQRNLQLATDAT